MNAPALSSQSEWTAAHAKWCHIYSRAKAIANARYRRHWHVALYFARRAGCPDLHCCHNWLSDLTGDRRALAEKALARFQVALESGRMADRVATLAHNKYMVPVGAARSYCNL